ncbi:beta-alanine-activating enzyme [Diachasma alloeum]|uniref:beta-alanine-activating enzyme n=1 Tax=Diachasma alloeum TaxID=454923 RepID=UPI0007384884|nr:beta-alanine-activating enzyme [Diachasma alloeum]
MDPLEVKRYKSNDTSKSPSPKVLSDVINWLKPANIAIEYHDLLENSIEITYNALYKVSKRIERLLEDCCESMFIGISPDVPSICIPALMIGINLSNNAFVCLQSVPLDTGVSNDGLEIEYFFAKKPMKNTNVIKELHIHDESLLFLKFRQCSPKSTLEGNNIYAYAVTTSGSTGDPVVVRVSHASIIPNIADLSRIFELSSEDKVAQFIPLTFDPCVIEIFMTLSCGGTLFVTSSDMKNDPQKLLASVLASNVTIMQSTPSLLMHRWSFHDLKSTIFGEQSYLRILVLGGESFPSPGILFNWKHSYNKCRFFNIYGITEVSCWASINEIFPTSHPRDLGQILSETMFEVRNENDTIISEGEGQLYVGSNSRICLINTEKMEEMKLPVFRDTGDLVLLDKSGKIFLNGRKNRRVKRFGHRINLQQLENHVNQLDIVGNSHAIFLPKNQTLHIFFTSRHEINEESDDQKLTTDVLQHVKKLSSIYQPNKIHLIKSFPVTTNGKICIDSLRRICSIPGGKFDIADNAKIFHAIWSNYVTTHDSGFVESGGTSVIALQIANEMSERTGNEYPELIGRMLRNETLESCTVYVSQAKLNVMDKIVESGKSESSKEALNSSKNILNSVNTIQKSDEENIWLWQKCRGKIIFNNFEDSENIDISKPPGKTGKFSRKKSCNLSKCVDASPTIFCYGGKIYATVGSHSGIICTIRLRAEGSEEKSWTVQLPDRIEASILIENYFRGIVGCYDGFLYCIDLTSGEIMWKLQTGDTIKCSAVFCSERKNIFFGSYDHHVYCVLSKDGTTIWKAKPSNASISATPIVHETANSVLLGTLDGTCVSLNQTTGKILWIRHLKHPIFSAPVISHNQSIIFCDVSGVVAAFDLKDGKQVRTMNSQ